MLWHTIQGPWMREFGVDFTGLHRVLTSTQQNTYGMNLSWDCSRISRSTFVPDLTNVFLKQWSKIPMNKLLNLLDSLLRRDEAVIAANWTTPHETLRIKNPKLLAIQCTFLIVRISLSSVVLEPFIWSILSTLGFCSNILWQLIGQDVVLSYVLNYKSEENLLLVRLACSVGCNKLTVKSSYFCKTKKAGLTTK